MVITIDDFEVLAIIGIYDHERSMAQPIRIRISFEYPFINGKYIDYALLTEQITNLFIEKKFLLLEDAVLFLETFLPSQYPEISDLSIALCKPNIFENGRLWVSNTLMRIK